MFKKHTILLSIIVSLSLLFIATTNYPGGSQQSKLSVGFSWQNNYLCNLFNETAMKGAHNTARPWAISGMLFLCISFALFFISFSSKIPNKLAANMVKYFGVSAMFFAFLATTPYHDIMITVASTSALVSIFYITVLIFKSKLTAFKWLSIFCMIILYTCNYIYYSGHYIVWLPIMQKVALAVTLIWLLALHYGTTKQSFQNIKFGKKASKF